MINTINLDQQYNVTMEQHMIHSFQIQLGVFVLEPHQCVKEGYGTFGGVREGFRLHSQHILQQSPHYRPSH